MDGEAAVFEKLARVASIRGRFAELFKPIVEAHRHTVPESGPIVEVGSGDGYLADFLPPSTLERVTFTEPTSIGIDRLLERFESARVQQGSAESLPFEDDSVSAVIACCVFDLVENLDAAWSEWTRILAPGGVVIHWLDLATDLHPLFSEVVQASNLCALPNVFTDPGKPEWPEDLMLIPEAQLDVVVGALESRRDPFATPLAAYRDAFRESVGAAVQAFTSIHESTEARLALKHAFRSALSGASPAQKKAFASFEGRPISSSRVFHQRLLDSMPNDFQLLSARIERRSSKRELESGQTSSAWRSVVGFIQSGILPNAEPPVEHLEFGAHVFVARKKP